MILRRVLLSLLGLWVGLGVVLAPSRPMPGMGMAPTPAQQVAAAQGNMTGHAMPGHGGHGDAQPDATGRHEVAPSKNAAPGPAEQKPSSHDHLARCVLCVVGAGTLALVVRVVWASSPARVYTMKLRLPAQPRRFRHFRSRAPPAVVPF